MNMNEERLEKFEAMLTDVQEEYDSVCATLAGLRAQEKVRTATYQQLFARKMTLESFLSLYERNGLVEDGDRR